MLPIKETELATFAPIAPVGEPPRAKYERLIMTAKKVPSATTVVVHPCEETSLRGAVDAASWVTPRTSDHVASEGRPRQGVHLLQPPQAEPQQLGDALLRS
jgi:hypothetical protein